MTSFTKNRGQGREPRRVELLRILGKSRAAGISQPGGPELQERLPAADERSGGGGSNPVRRILVIQDVGLWIDLNRHLSGVGSVELVEAMSFEQAQILAQVERPEIVVYRADGSGPEPEELLRRLRERGVEKTVVIAVERAPGSRDPSGRSASAAHNSEAIVCSAEELLELVSSLLNLDAERAKPSVELLAHYDVEAGSSEEARSGFAVVLELTERRLLLETDLSLEPGTEMLLNFFLQVPDSDAQRSNVSLSCEVTQCRDEAKLIHSVRVTKLADDSRQAIQLYAASCAEGAAR